MFADYAIYSIFYVIYDKFYDYSLRVFYNSSAFFVKVVSSTCIPTPGTSEIYFLHIVAIWEIVSNMYSYV